MSPVTTVITVTTAGTPIQVRATSLSVAKILVEPLKANLGRILVGAAGMVLATGVGVMIDLAAPGAGATGLVQQGLIAAEDGTNVLDLSDYWIDASVSGEKARVTYWPA